MAQTHDSIVIGTGQSGPSPAARLTKEGLNTAIVERKPLGGDRVDVGRIATKASVASARPASTGRTSRHAGYAASRRLRKRIEEGFGWIKATGGLAKTRRPGLDRVGRMFILTAAAYNLVRLPKLLAEAAS